MIPMKFKVGDFVIFEDKLAEVTGVYGPDYGIRVALLDDTIYNGYLRWPKEHQLTLAPNQDSLKILYGNIYEKE